MKVSLSMAYSPKKAASLVTAQVDEIVVNLAKIFSHKPSTTDVEWRDEIKNKHLFEISKKANKTSDKKGHLDRELLESLWVDAFDQHFFVRHIDRVFSDTAYRRKAKSGKLEQVSQAFSELRDLYEHFAVEFADVVLAKDWNRITNFSDDLFALTLDIREQKLK